MYEIKSDKLLATEKILTDTTISKLSGCRVSFNFEQFYGLGMPSKKKIAEKETLVHTGGRGVKKNPFF